VPDPQNPQSFNRYSYVYNNALNYTDPTGHFTDEQIEDWTGYKIEDLNEDTLEFLRGLLLGDEVRQLDGAFHPNLIESYQVDLNEGNVVSRSSEGSSYTLGKMMEQGFDVNKFVSVVRPSAGQIYVNSEYLPGWGPDVETSENTMTPGARVGIVSGIAVASGVAGFGVTCLGASLATGGLSCAAAPAVGLGTGIAAGIIVGIATDPMLGTPGLQPGDTTYSYKFTNGQSFSTVVNQQVIL
jgi:hypothetical protein